MKYLISIIIVIVISGISLISCDSNLESLLRIKRQEKYTTRYDNFDVAGVLASKRLVRVYLNCLLNKGPCTPEGKELKKYIPDAVVNGCNKCSNIQKKQAGIVLSHLLLNYRDDFNALTALYDPDGKARKMYNIDQDLDDYDYLDNA